MMHRYAIYFAPAPDSAWWEFGTRWLGRDEFRDIDRVQPRLPDILPAELRRITTQARRYGFHATLKAPFRLRQDCTANDLISRMQSLASSLKPLVLGSMQASTLGDFVALTPDSPSEELMALARTCVTDLDDLRAPLDHADLTRRRLEHLDPREQELLHQYGYPHVLERFRFHVTLTGPVPPSTSHKVLRAVAEPLAHLNASTPLLLDRLCLFVEPAPGQAFLRIADRLLSS